MPPVIHYSWPLPRRAIERWLQTHSAGKGRVLRYALLPSHELAAASGLGSLSVRWFESFRMASLWTNSPLGLVEQVLFPCTLRAGRR